MPSCPWPRVIQDEDHCAGKTLYDNGFREIGLRWEQDPAINLPIRPSQLHLGVPLGVARPLTLAVNRFSSRPRAHP
jgi:hypothetical protein